MSLSIFPDRYSAIHNALQDFRIQTNALINTDDFDPAALTSQLTKALRNQDIDLTEIFGSLEETEKLLMSCVHTDIEQLHTDQLYHALIGSTRTPYHHPDGTLKNTPSKHHVIINIEKLTHLLITHSPVQ